LQGLLLLLNALLLVSTELLGSSKGVVAKAVQVLLQVVKPQSMVSLDYAVVEVDI